MSVEMMDGTEIPKKILLKVAIHDQQLARAAGLT
jgi:hypothetical protein